MLNENQYKGAIVGFAIGDALGATTEFLTEQQIDRRYGRLTEISGGGMFDWPLGSYTDDTEMTIAVAKGIVQSPSHPIPYIGQQFLEWRATDPVDIGITIQMTFELFNGNWFETALTTHQLNGQKSDGNGTLMRCLPVALAYADQAKMEEVTRLQSKMTHYGEQAVEACLLYNRIAHRLIYQQPVSLAQAIEQEVKGTVYESILTAAPSCEPTGYVVDTLKWVLHWLLRCETFEEVVVCAANKGGDSDTIAAIAGGLKGLVTGYDQLPRRYVEQLLGREGLEQLAQQLLAVAQQTSAEHDRVSPIADKSIPNGDLLHPLIVDVSFDNWVMPSEQAIQKEYNVEYTHHIRDIFGNLWNTIDDFRTAIHNAEVVELTKEQDLNMYNRSHTSTVHELLRLISRYRSWPEYRNMDSLRDMIMRFRHNRPMTMPIILRKAGRLYIMSGNTKSDLAGMMNVPLKAIVIDI